MEEKGTLKPNEYHPAAPSAMEYVQNFRINNPQKWLTFMESLASTAISDNRTSEILLSTVERLNGGLPVSDRYLLGLAWFIKNNLEE